MPEVLEDPWMVKTHYDDDQAELYKVLGGHMATLFEDRFAIKSAASDLFTREKLAQYAPDKDHFLMHIVGLGDEEHYGPNRNGDAWDEQTCRDRHHTFVSDGAFYREHRSHNKKAAQGSIVASGYHPSLHRIELLIHGNIKKAAHVFEKAKNGDEVHGSMSCRLKHDYCSCCKKASKNPGEYCDDLKYNMLQYLPKFKKYAYAKNPNCTFFDYSDVENPADRIAHFLEFRFHGDDMRKAAASKRIILGTEWAEYQGLAVPSTFVRSFPVLKHAKLARLADEERWINSTNGKESGDAMKRAFVDVMKTTSLQDEISEEELKTLRQMIPGTLFREMAKRAAVMPFLAFAAYAYNTSIEDARNSAVVKRAAAAYLPTIFNRLEKEGSSDLEHLFDASGEGVTTLDDGRTSGALKVLKKMSSTCSIDPASVRRRVMTSVATGATAPRYALEKPGSDIDDRRALTLAECYGHYKLAALVDIEKLTGVEITPEQQLLITCTNQVSHT